MWKPVAGSCAYFTLFADDAELRSEERIRQIAPDRDRQRKWQWRALYGEAGNDTLIGKGGGDFLFGGSGADILDSSFGWDVLSGGAGADLFRFATALGAGNVDTLQEFFIADGIGSCSAAPCSWMWACSQAPVSRLAGHELRPPHLVRSSDRCAILRYQRSGGWRRSGSRHSRPEPRSRPYTSSS
jgi:hypothetical protein